MPCRLARNGSRRYVQPRRNIRVIAIAESVRMLPACLVINVWRGIGAGTCASSLRRRRGDEHRCDLRPGERHRGDVAWQRPPNLRRHACGFSQRPTASSYPANQTHLNVARVRRREREIKRRYRYHACLSKLNIKRAIIDIAANSAGENLGECACCVCGWQKFPAAFWRKAMTAGCSENRKT